MMSTAELFACSTRYCARYGLEFDFTDTTDPENVAAALSPDTRVVWLETPTNPLLAITDIDAVAEMVHAHPATRCWL